MKHAASVHPEPGSNSPLSEKFMSLVHIPMNRSTSFYCSCPSHFFQNQQVFIVFSYSIVNVLFIFSLKRKSPKFFSSVPYQNSSLPFPSLSLIASQRHLPSYHLNFLCQLIFYFSLRVFGIFKITIQNH